MEKQSLDRCTWTLRDRLKRVWMGLKSNPRLKIWPRSSASPGPIRTKSGWVWRRRWSWRERSGPSRGSPRPPRGGRGKNLTEEPRDKSRWGSPLRPTENKKWELWQARLFWLDPCVVVLHLLEGHELKAREDREEKKPSTRWDSKPRPFCYKACALPLCYLSWRESWKGKKRRTKNKCLGPSGIQTHDLQSGWATFYPLWYNHSPVAPDGFALECLTGWLSIKAQPRHHPEKHFGKTCHNLTFLSHSSVTTEIGGSNFAWQIRDATFTIPSSPNLLLKADHNDIVANGNSNEGTGERRFLANMPRPCRQKGDVYHSSSQFLTNCLGSRSSFKRLYSAFTRFFQVDDTFEDLAIL